MATDDTERANARPDNGIEKPATGGEAVTARFSKPLPLRELAEFRAFILRSSGAPAPSASFPTWKPSHG